MTELFRKTFHARWGDMDFNAHMANTAYLDIAADVRMMYFQEHGFSMREFERLRVGPVILRDELDYYRELRLLETIEVTLATAAITADAARARLRNDFYREDGKLCARVTSLVGWLDLDARRMRRPPDEVAALMLAIGRTDDFEEIGAT